MRHDVANDTYTSGSCVIARIFRISEWNGSPWSGMYYHYDVVGNVTIRADSSGNVVESIDQEAYGNVKIGAQSGYHLTTKEYDSLSELYYFYLRWYNSEIGRFISISPLRPDKEPSYACVGNNPARYTDPS